MMSMNDHELERIEEALRMALDCKSLPTTHKQVEWARQQLANYLMRAARKPPARCAPKPTARCVRTYCNDSPVCVRPDNCGDFSKPT